MRKKLIKFMRSRNWHKKIAKTKPYTQSLFEHSLVVYDIIDSIIKLLSNTNRKFSDNEKNILRISAILHDIGKEEKDWQKAAKNGLKPPPHINATLANIGISNLKQYMKIENEQTILKCIGFHHKALQSEGNIISSMISETEIVNWKELQDFIDSADNLASCGSLFDATQLLENKSNFKIGKLFNYTYHKIYLRGVSSVFLHRACQEAYKAKGWEPLLYFQDGTLYLTSGDKDEVTKDEIMGKLINHFEKEKYFGERITHLLLGDPTKSIFPKPELFDTKIISLCLNEAYSLASRKTFSNKPLEDKKGHNDRKTIISNYLDQESEPTDEEISKYTNMFSESYPEMCVFAYSKAIYNFFISSDKNLVNIFMTEYNKKFGNNAFDFFLACRAQLDPAKQFKQVIQPFWNININNVKVENMHWKKRKSYLVSILTKIFNMVFKDNKSKPLDERISDIIIKDLIYPNFTEIPCQDILCYLTSKSRIFLGPKKAKTKIIGFICPVCNQKTEAGIRSNENIVNSSNSFTNRANFGQSISKAIWICDSCKYERYLLQVLTGFNGVFKRALFLYPQYNFSNRIGDEFLDTVDDLRQKTDNLMSELSENPDLSPDFSRTTKIANNIMKNIDNIESKSIEDFIITEQKINDFEKKAVEVLMEYNPDLPLKKDEHGALSIINQTFTKDYKKFGEFIADLKKDEQIRKTFSITKKKPKRSDIDKALIEYFGYDFPFKPDLKKALKILNGDFITDYSDWDIFFDDLKNNKIESEVAHDIVKKVYMLFPKYKIIAQTPNFIIIPLKQPLQRSDDADVNGCIRELFISIIFALKLNCSTTIADDILKINIEQRKGSVFVPENSLLRQLVGDSWLREYDFNNEKGINIKSDIKWLEAIASALCLSYRAAYSERTNLYEILKSKTKGHLLRRIEMKDKEQVNNSFLYDYIDNIWEVKI